MEHAICILLFKCHLLNIQQVPKVDREEYSILLFVQKKLVLLDVITVPELQPNFSFFCLFIHSFTCSFIRPFLRDYAGLGECSEAKSLPFRTLMVKIKETKGSLTQMLPKQSCIEG